MQFVFKPNSIITLVGPSFSGKSTFAKNLSTKLQAQGKKVLILSSDAIRRSLLGNDENSNARTTQAFGVSKQAFEILQTQLKAYISFPVNYDYVIVDTTGLSEDFRNGLVETAKEYHYGSYLVVMDLPSKLLEFRCNSEVMVPVLAQQLNTLKKKVFPNLNRKAYLATYTIRKELMYSDFEAVVPESENVKIATISEENNDKLVYVIGDVHECVTELKNMLTAIKSHSDGREHTVYLNGDWIDKGNNTKELIEYLTEVLNSSDNIFLIRGNHENYVYKKLKDSSYVYTLNEETKHFSSLPVFLNDTSLQEMFFKLYEDSYSYLHVNKTNIQAYVTHSCAKEKFLSKTDPTSLKNIYKQSLNWDVPVLDQVSYIFDEASFNSPYHIFGHIIVGRKQHIYKNKISIDQGCVEGGYLTACCINLEVSEKHLTYLYVDSENPDRHPEFIKDFSYVLDKRVNKNKSYANLDPFTVRTVNRLIKQKNIYMSPTMAPAPSWHCSETDTYDLETVDSAVRYLKKHGVTEVIAQKKHMGSRCQTYIYPNLEDCYAISRNGWRVKDSAWLQKALELQWNKYKDMIVSDFLVLDNELLPWSALGKGLIEHDFKAYHTSINNELTLLKECGFGQFDTSLDSKLESISKFKTQLDIYGTETEPYLEPFGVIYNGVSLLEEDLTTLLPKYDIPYEYFNLELEESVKALNDFYTTQTENGCTEGIVVKPAIWNKHTPPYMKIRNSEYLRLVYGYNYQDSIKKLVLGKNISGKVRTSIKEQNLNIRLIANKDSTTEILFPIYADILNEFNKEKTLDPRL